MGKEKIMIKSVRKDRRGFSDQKDKWYNGTSEFDVGRGDEVEVEVNSGGILQNAKVIKKATPYKKNFNSNKPDEKIKLGSVCLSYAKDLVVAGKLDLNEVEKTTKDFYGYIMGVAK